MCFQINLLGNDWLNLEFNQRRLTHDKLDSQALIYITLVFCTMSTQHTDFEDQTLIFLGAVSDRIASMLGEHVPQFEFIYVSSLHRIWSKYRHHANLPYVATG